MENFKAYFTWAQTLPPPINLVFMFLPALVVLSVVGWIGALFN